MDAISSVTRATQVISLAGLTGSREIAPVAPVSRARSGDLLMQPDTYERGTADSPLPLVTYSARRSAAA